MKTLLNGLLCFTITILLFSCSKSKRAEAMLKDQELRDEILVKMTSDTMLINEMLNNINDNERVLQRIRNDKKMMRSLMDQDNMMNLMKNDSSITNMLMCNVMKIAGKDTNLCRKIDIQMQKNLLFEDPNLNLFPYFQSAAKDKLLVPKKIKIPESIK